MHKEQFPQTLKGLCIIFVVLIHLPWGQEGEWTAWLWIAVRKVINFAVATFFFLSAYYTKPYERIIEYGILNYYKDRLKRLLIPYNVWAIIYIFILPIIQTGDISEYWLYYLLTGKGPTYFLLALTQFTLLNPFLQKYKKSAGLNVVFILITPLYLCFYYIYNFHTGSEFKPEQFFCFPWFACYYLGLLMQEPKYSDKIDRKSTISVLTYCIYMLLLSVIESAFIYHNTGIFSFAISQITIGSIAYSLAIILLFRSLWKDKMNNQRNWLTYLGDYSMGIFLMHPLFMWIFKYIVFHVNCFKLLYLTSLGYVLINISILFFSVYSSFLTAKYISLRYPKLTKPLGLR